MSDRRTSAPGGIGVFDSGVGGLTVLRALRAVLPHEHFIYLGDTARLPYGTKSPDTVIRYSLQCAAALLARDVRCLVVACNTASASALDALRSRYPDLPITGVIEPGAAAAVAASAARHIAVIGTEGTVAGGAYQSAIRRLSPTARVTARACSLFVAMAEEGWTHGPIAEAVARRYLDPVFADGTDAPDTLVLGCTHFPSLSGAIAAVIPAQVRIVDSAVTTAAAVAAALGAAASPGALPVGETAAETTSAGTSSDSTAPAGATLAGARPVTPARPGRIIWLATDGAARFARVGARFFGEALRAEDVELVDL